ncbi:hypothetical protein V5799_027120 [Amblyomma americanum]|uniref:Uncharacterized protein n=1 Tax=Amblyomma americanum TaxID=6943 RepID=A0AAQ4DGL8_AMBAM
MTIAPSARRKGSFKRCRRGGAPELGHWTRPARPATRAKARCDGGGEGCAVYKRRLEGKPADYALSTGTSKTAPAHSGV